MSFFSCTVEITNSSSSDLSDPVQILLSGQCSVSMPPLLRPGSIGSATFTGHAGIDLDGQFTYKLLGKVEMLAFRFKVPSDRSNGNYYKVALFDPTSDDQKNLLQIMDEALEKEPQFRSGHEFIVLSNMSHTANAMLELDVHNVVLCDIDEL